MPRGKKFTAEQIIGKSRTPNDWIELVRTHDNRDVF
jgi:hypothetical protein